MISAWAHENRLTLGELKVDDKSNEITAVPELLDLQWLEGTVVTTDALNCQKEIAARIREKKADYLLCLKTNHPTLQEEVEGLFLSVEEGRTAKDH